MSAEPTARRETLPLADIDARLVDRLMDKSSLERWALEQSADINDQTSKSLVLRAAFRIGTDRIRAEAMQEGYRRLAEQESDQEAADERAIVNSRRARQQAAGEVE